MFIKINDIPTLINEGKMTKKEAVNYLAEFTFKNPVLFGLEKEDEDFKNELILALLEKGERILTSYNPDIGSFFSFFFATVLGRIKALRKRECRLNIQNSCIFEEIIQDFSHEDTKYIGYKEIKPVKNGYVKPPYAAKKISPEDIEGFFKQSKLTKEGRTMMILFFKYAFFIDYEQLKNICRLTGIDYEFLVNIKDYCMDYLEGKIQAQTTAYEARNRTYFLRKKTDLQIRNLEKEVVNSPSQNLLAYKLDSLQNKYFKQTARLEKDNSEIAKKASHIVLQDKQIAGFLGLCERQVRYYISRAKNNKIKLSNIKSEETAESD